MAVDGVSSEPVSVSHDNWEDTGKIFTCEWQPKAVIGNSAKCLRTLASRVVWKILSPQITKSGLLFAAMETNNEP